MTTTAGQAAVDDVGTATKARRCVLFVHGVGQQRKSQTLLWMGSALVDWVMRWSTTFYGRGRTNVGRVELSFAPYDEGIEDKPPYATLELPDQQWVMAEAWWAGSNFHPDFGTMLGWSLLHLFDLLAQMIRATVERAKYLFAPKQHSSAPNAFWRAIDLLNCAAVCVLYVVAAIVGYPLIIALMILAQIPIESVQNFIVLKLLQPVLTAAAGEFKLYLDDEVQAGNIRRRVADAARELLRRTGCDDLTIIAHSEGAVVSLGMLTDPCSELPARRVKLITLGAGLNKSWLVRPDLDRLFGPLTGNAYWLDVWASYDPVPAGPLDPSRRKLPPDNRPCQMTDVYQPNGVPSTPLSAQVTNGMEILTDHGGYFDNDEQVLIRLAAEISAPNYADSVFWPLDNGADPEAFLLNWVRKRRVRVSALALWRDIAVGAFLAAAVAPWWLNWLVGVQPWGPLAQVPASAGLAGVLVGALRSTRDWLAGLPGIFAPLADLVSMLLGVPAVLGLAALGGLACWIVYRLVVWLWWSRWDRADRAAFVSAAAAHSRQRLAATPIQR